MTLSRIKNLLSWGQPDTNPAGRTSEAHKFSPPSVTTDSVEIEEKSCKNYTVSFEVHTIMKRRRTSPKVILKASITTVLVVAIAFIIIYTILLKYFTTTVPYQQYGGWSRHRLKFIAKQSQDRHLENKLLDGHLNDLHGRPVRWNISDIYYEHSIKPLCIDQSKFIILITSSPDHFNRRNEIRKTWCQPEKYALPNGSWQCIFLIGEPKVIENSDMSISQIRKKLQHESQNHKDILRGSYVDSYRNLTYKVVHGLHWVSRTCPSEYVLKTDDDCFVNSKLLYRLVMRHPNAFNVYIGNVYTELEKRRVVRNKLNRWHVPVEIYPEQYYPQYASGAGYLLSKDLIHRLVNVCKYIQPIPNEDAYVGILASKIGVSPAQSSRFTLMSAGWTICNYLYFIVIHSVVADQQETMHNNTLLAAQQCQGSSDIITWN